MLCVHKSKFAKKKLFKYVTSRHKELLELAHLDLVNLKNTANKGEKRYYIIFIDNYSRYNKVYLLDPKNEAE